MTQIIIPELVSLDADLGATKDDVIRSLSQMVAASGRATSADGLYQSALEREAKSPTGLPGGIGIPHCRSEAVTEASLAFARLNPPIDFRAPDGPAELIFLIAAPEGGGDTHLQLLTKLARSLVKEDFKQALRDASSPQEVVDIIQNVVEPPAQANAAPASGAGATAASAGTAAPAASGPGVDRYLVAITACPTGIAHTFMAAEALQETGDRIGIPVQVETQGSGSYKPFQRDVIAGAAGVIFATDVGVKGRERFAGLPVVASGVKRAINEPEKMIREAIAHADNPNGPRVEAGGGGSGGDAEGASDVGLGTKTRQVLLTGVSYMIPFVAAGGLLIALGFLLGGYQISFVADHILGTYSLANLPNLQAVQTAVDPTTNAALFTAGQTSDLNSSGILLFLGAGLFKLGGLAFGFLVPALAGYIAFGIADRPGIAPGFTAGAVAVFAGAGFIGGLVGGVLAGLAAYWIGQFDVPKWLRGLMPVVIIPLFASLFAGGLLLFLLGKPLADLTIGLSDWLSGLSGSSAIVLGIILGLMMCFDLGGPVNKAAYAFAVAGLNVQEPATLKIMAAVMAAGMVPPLAMALATAVRPKLFTEPERENGKAAWLLGASFITEGAIPFAAADPLRIIPPSMVGGAVTGALIMATDVTLQAPHGGIFVFFAMGKPLLFVVSLIVGFVVTAALVIALKSTKGAQKSEHEAEKALANA